MQYLIGNSIESTAEQHSVINMRIGLTKNIDTVDDCLQDHKHLHRQYDKDVSRDQSDVLE